MTSITFTIVLQAELFVDIFFWMSAFLASYFLLIKLQENQGKFGTSIFTLVLHRVARILPVYMFVLGFFWKFLPLFGGEGPIFFYYH
jgi:peptidoglycan/LPS O-acetylase OafA/YrhL